MVAVIENNSAFAVGLVRRRRIVMGLEGDFARANHFEYRLDVFFFGIPVKSRHMQRVRSLPVYVGVQPHFEHCTLEYTAHKVTRLLSVGK